MRAGVHHYLGLTRNTLESDLQKESVRLKKYFYALRPVLAATWIVERKECPPMEFRHLRAMIKDSEIDNKIDELLQRKAEVNESFTMPPDSSLNAFIQAQMNYCAEASAGFVAKNTEVAALNELFRKTIGI